MKTKTKPKAKSRKLTAKEQAVVIKYCQRNSKVPFANMKKRFTKLFKRRVTKAMIVDAYYRSIVNCPGLKARGL